MADNMNVYVVKIARYLEETSNHVMYRVTPIFNREELMCRGVLMEAYSVEDNGEGICFNVFCIMSSLGLTTYILQGNQNTQAVLLILRLRQTMFLMIMITYLITGRC